MLLIGGDIVSIYTASRLNEHIGVVVLFGRPWLELVVLLLHFCGLQLALLILTSDPPHQRGIFLHTTATNWISLYSNHCISCREGSAWNLQQISSLVNKSPGTTKHFMTS